MRFSKLLIILLLLLGYSRSRAADGLAVVISVKPTSMEEYAAKELCRYVNLLTRQLPMITTTLNSNGFILSKDIRVDCGAQGYHLKKENRNGVQVISIAANDDAGLLYGVYGFLEEHMGISFGFDGDIIPERKTVEELFADIDETKTPAVAIRGFLPWTNFPQSATSYSWEDWKFILDQAAKMRMNFLLIHNYSGEEGHNEMFHNFEVDNKLSRVWNATAKTGHAWGSYPGWDVNKYPFGSKQLFDDYDFGADCALHNETLTNKQVFRKGVNEFQRVIAYAHTRGIKIGLGLDINLIPDYYGLNPDDPKVIAARVKQIETDYKDLDYLFCFQSESLGQEGAVKERKEWRSIFDGFYNGLKKTLPKLRFAVAGWGIRAQDVATLPEDVICAPISYYSDACESGAAFGAREYWGCPWLQRDFNSSVYYYPYNMDISNTIKAWNNRAPNMKGFYALTWVITDAIKPKLWFMSRAAWDSKNEFNSAEKLYQKYAELQYGKKAASFVTPIINQNEAMGSDFSECRWTPPFAVGRTERRAKDQPLADAWKEAEEQLNKANAQIKIIDSAIKYTPEFAGQLYRLNLLKSRIAAARDHIILNMYASSRSHDINEMVRSWVGNFNTRVTDISSLGNVVSMQNRFVQKDWYDASVKQMNTFNALPPTNLEVHGTKEGALLEWETAGSNYKAFQIFRDGKKLDEVKGNIFSYEDKINGLHKYEVRLQLFGNDDPQPSISVPCQAGNADMDGPQIVVISPPTSVLEGQTVCVKASLLDNRADALLSATLFYKNANEDEWKQLPMTRKVKSVFVAEIPCSEKGIEYYISASDGDHASFFPADGSVHPLSCIQTGSKQIEPLAAPQLTANKQSLKWHAVNGASYYQIYRSDKKEFTVSNVNLVTYLSADAALTFADNGYDFKGNKLTGELFYKITAVDQLGYESKSSQAISIKY